MPDDALPRPRPTVLPGQARVRHEFRDVLGRPLTGAVTLTPRAGARHDGLTVPPAPVTVEVAGGVLQAVLAPGTYRVEGTLRTADGARVNVRDEITLDGA